MILKNFLVTVLSRKIPGMKTGLLVSIPGLDLMVLLQVVES
jgi:hypothetical protein